MKAIIVDDSNLVHQIKSGDPKVLRNRVNKFLNQKYIQDGNGKKPGEQKSKATTNTEGE